MQEIIFQKEALKEYNNWKKKDKKVSQRIKKLIEAIQDNPFKGIGKPEPLRQNLKGYWSRRITKEHRLVYKVTEESIIVIACKYHY